MDNLDRIQIIDAYFSAFGRHHVQKASQLLQPLHVPGRDPLPDFSAAARQPFEPQAHVIAAAVEMLDATRRVIIATECGSGFMSLATMTHYPDRLKAGIDIVGISNFLTFLQITQSYRRDLHRAEYGDELDSTMREFFKTVSRSRRPIESRCRSSWSPARTTRECRPPSRTRSSPR
jgi:hypothetical protein